MSNDTKNSRAKDYLEHMAEALCRIERYLAGVDHSGFLADERTQDAVIRMGCHWSRLRTAASIFDGETQSRGACSPCTPPGPLLVQGAGPPRTWIPCRLALLTQGALRRPDECRPDKNSGLRPSDSLSG